MGDTLIWIAVGLLLALVTVGAFVLREWFRWRKSRI